MADNLIPKNVIEEFKRLLQGSRGYDAKRAEARRFVYTTMIGKHSAFWWNQNSEKLLAEMGEVERSMTNRTQLTKGDNLETPAPSLRTDEAGARDLAGYATNASNS